MRVVNAGYKIIPRDNHHGDMAVIELAARTCYKSEDRITDGSAEKLVRGLIGRRHLSAIEHGAYAFEIQDWHMFECVTNGLAMIREKLGRAPMITATDLNHRQIVSGNCRAWRELVQLAQGYTEGAGIAAYFIPYLDRAYIDDLCDVTDYTADFRVKPLTDAELAEDPVQALIHLRQTVRFVVDRGVSHEFVRHRLMSFSQESTRFCCYATDKFGGEITVIRPCFLAVGDPKYEIWEDACHHAELAYIGLMRCGSTAQEARAVLPTSTKTELIMTGTLSQWGHFFDLRARQLTGSAHPQAVEVAKPLMREMAERFPAIFAEV